MKFLKIAAIFVFTVLALALLLSIMLPTKQHIERSIVINASAIEVYQQLIRLENFNKWAVWNNRDSSVRITHTGKDGTVGASSTWSGSSDLSGKGVITIIRLEPMRKIIHKVEFTEPHKAEAESEFDLSEIAGGTRVTWEFDLYTPRPRNIFNLFFNLDKKMGKDFEEGLGLMKAALEKGSRAPLAATFDVRTMNFPATEFAMIRQQIKQSDIAEFYSQHLHLVKEELEKLKIEPSTPHGLYYLWDDKMQLTDLAAAFPVPEGTKMNNPLIQLAQIPASKAVYVDHFGPYTGLNDAYNTIRKYISDNSLTQKSPIIEQYITDPVLEKDPAKWHTKVIFLVE